MKILVVVVIQEMMEFVMNSKLQGAQIQMPIIILNLQLKMAEAAGWLGWRAAGRPGD